MKALRFTTTTLLSLSLCFGAALAVHAEPASSGALPLKCKRCDCCRLA